MTTTLSTVDVGTESVLRSTSQQEDWIIRRAIQLLEQRISKRDLVLTHKEDTQSYVRLQLMHEPEEAFAALFFDSAHRVLAFEVLLHGSSAIASLQPRLVVKRALFHNASAVIFAHSQPLECHWPSEGERQTIQELKTALWYVDVSVFDHLVLGEGKTFSFAKGKVL